MIPDDEVKSNRNLEPQLVNPPDSGEEDAETEREVAEIREEIEQTRAEMSGTIDEIQARLSPANLKEQVKEQVMEQYEQAKETVREATLGKVEDIMERVSDTVYETRRSMVDTIKANPIPATLVGVGLAWLWMKGRGNDRRSADRYYDDYRSYGERSRAYAGGTSSGFAQQGRPGTWERNNYAASGVADRAGQTTSGVVGQVQQTASDLVDKTKETVSDAVTRTQETAGYLAEQAQWQARRAGDSIETAMRDYPLAVGAIAVAVGVGVGLAIPQTRKENELMGQTRDAFVGKAQSAAQGTLNQVERAAERVTEDLVGKDKQAEQGGRGPGR